MPIGAYFKGSGSKVMSNMQREYGKKQGKSVFYATAQKMNMKPKAPDVSAGIAELSRPRLKRNLP